MRVFMLGWEFPPFISGGLGTACYGLTKAMSGIGTDIMFVLPRPVATPFSTHVKLVSPREGSPLAAPTTEFRLDEFDNVTFRTVSAQLSSTYNTPADYEQQVREERERKARMGDAALNEPSARSAVGAAKPGGPKSASSPGQHYAGDLFSEVQRYAMLAAEIARQE